MRAPDPGHTDPNRFPAVPIDGGARVYFIRNESVIGEGRIVGGFGLHGRFRVEVLPLDARAKAMFGEGTKIIFDRLTGQPVNNASLEGIFVVSRTLVDKGRAPRRFNLQEG